MSGFTLVELMAAMVITLVALLGLVQAMDFAAEQNVRTMQRDEAVRVAEDWMARFRATPFTMISTSTPPARYQYGPQAVPSRVRGGGRTYTVLRSTMLSGDGKMVDMGVRVGWKFKGMSSAHEVHSVKGQD